MRVKVYRVVCLAIRGLKSIAPLMIALKAGGRAPNQVCPSLDYLLVTCPFPSFRVGIGARVRMGQGKGGTHMPQLLLDAGHSVLVIVV